MDSSLAQIQDRLQEYLSQNSTVLGALSSLSSLFGSLASVDFGSKPVLYGILGGVGFLFLLLFGLARHHMLSWSMKGAVFGILFGIVLTLVAEAFLLASGTAALARVLQSNTTPANVRVFLQEHLGDLVSAVSSQTETLGVSTANCRGDLVAQYRTLSSLQQNRIKALICSPAK